MTRTAAPQLGVGEPDRLPTATAAQVRTAVAALARPRRGRLAATALVLTAATGLELPAPPCWAGLWTSP